MPAGNEGVMLRKLVGQCGLWVGRGMQAFANEIEAEEAIFRGERGVPTPIDRIGNPLLRGLSAAASFAIFGFVALVLLGVL